MSFRVKLADIPPGGVLAVGGETPGLLLCRSDAGVHALRDSCPHLQLPLRGGRVRGDTLVCPHHGARFSLADGRSLSPLTANALELLPCRLEGNEVVVEGF